MLCGHSDISKVFHFLPDLQSRVVLHIGEGNNDVRQLFYLSPQDICFSNIPEVTVQLFQL